jgi:hypothetical protein
MGKVPGTLWDGSCLWRNTRTTECASLR